MTEDEARKVAAIACTADGGCAFCAGDLIDQLKKAYPEHAETFNKVYEDD